MKIFVFISLVFIFTSCGDSETVTEIIKLRSDTYISNYNDNNKSELNYLQISKSSTNEDRILLRLPTNDYDDDDGFFDKCFDDGNLCSMFFMPVTIAIKIVSTCDGKGLQASDLTSAILVLNTNDSSSISAGDLNLNLLAKPWWNNVSWNRAHPFSRKGKWSSPGGDIDTTITFNTNCNGLSSGSCAAGEIKFDVTDYFRDLLDEKSNTHYGLVVSANTTLALSTIYSVQSGVSSSPRIVATFTCSSSFVPETKTFYLGESF